jgi:hypothetical protein
MSFVVDELYSRAVQSKTTSETTTESVSGQWICVECMLF